MLKLCSWVPTIAEIFAVPPSCHLRVPISLFMQWEGAYSMYFKRAPCLDKVCSGGKRLLEDCLEKGNGFIETQQWFCCFLSQVVPIIDTPFFSLFFFLKHYFFTILGLKLCLQSRISEIILNTTPAEGAGSVCLLMSLE